MIYSLWYLVAIDTHFYAYMLKCQYFEGFFFLPHCLKSNLLQLSHNMFCKNVSRLAVARECIHMWQPLATIKWATFLQNILWKCCSKFNFEQCSLKRILKCWFFSIKMRFHVNQLSKAIKHHLISLYFKNQSPEFIYLLIMLAPVTSSLDKIYCI